jgi:hypothetical protein
LGIGIELIEGQEAYMQSVGLPLIVYRLPEDRDTHQSDDHENEGGENPILWSIQGVYEQSEKGDIGNPRREPYSPRELIVMFHMCYVRLGKLANGIPKVHFSTEPIIHIYHSALIERSLPCSVRRGEVYTRLPL